jgi:hypothetical protein
VLPFCRVLATDKKAAPNTTPVDIPPSEKYKDICHSHLCLQKE